MTDRLPTGSARLDEILHGGLLPNAVNLITGVPGSGKTILSQQIVFRNATRERPALYLTTLSEPLDKVLRYGQSLEFFDHAALEDGRVVYDDIGAIVGSQDLDNVLATIDRYLKDVRPGIVVIDSFRIIRVMSPNLATFRQFLYDLLRRLSASPTTSIWNSPYARDAVLEEAEAAVADAILALDIKQVAEREVRVVQVLKLRGSSYRSGEHGYRITKAGFEAFPRLAEEQIREPFELSETHVGTGIQALDELLADGGYWAGATTLVAGPSGIGKTLMGLHFVYRGAEAGEPGIVATFQESAAQLRRIVTSFGWSPDDPNAHVLSRGVVDINIDEWVYQLIELAEKTGAKRIVVDSLADVIAAARDVTRFREWMFSMTQRFSRAGVSLMLIIEVPDLFELQRISDEGISHLADNVILLQYLQEGSRLSRALTILKTRAMRHQPTVHRFDITPDGFVLGDEVSFVR
ncbi:MAG TPA: ATPase domain-containing protein [Candidatus Dormibacteraeota bacterium]|nr:ATPase domain-containing protein [Candidatus Dormibacteraeota bacterium]